LATLASIGWIVERALNVQNVFNPFVEDVARHAEWIGAIVLLVSLICWLLQHSGGLGEQWRGSAWSRERSGSGVYDGW
jgi:hypothetical protein